MLPICSRGLPKEKIKRASAFTESDKSGVRFDDLNAYFVEAIKCRDKGYFEAFIRAYEPVLQSRAERFVTRYNLSADDTEDIKQIFLETLWFAFLGYDAADPIPLLQYMKKAATMRHLDYIRTTKNACTVPTQNGYTERRKVMRIYNTRHTQTDRNSFKAFSRFFRKKAFFCRAIYDFFLKTPNKPLLSLVTFQKMWYNIFCSIVFS